jgi:hypothetical protein
MKALPKNVEQWKRTSIKIFENQEQEYSSDTTSISGEIFTPPKVTIRKKIIKRKKMKWPKKHMKL